MQINAKAKINLTLDVTGKLPSGYHTVKMVMQTVELHDTVTVEITGEGDVYTLENSKKFLPTDDRNLAMKAAKLFYKETGIKNIGTKMHIEKRIQVAAGLAGGSTDAAAVLVALNKLCKANLSKENLCEMGVKLGADVPYCIMGGTMLAEGIGEILSPLPKMSECYVVLCKPDFSVSTPEVYAKMNGGNIAIRPDTTGMIKALQAKDYDGICHRLYNVMQNVTGEKHSEISYICDELLVCGADSAVMSGSGPTTYGLFKNLDDAQIAFARLKAKFSDTHLSKICD